MLNKVRVLLLWSLVFATCVQPFYALFFELLPLKHIFMVLLFSPETTLVVIRTVASITFMTLESKLCTRLLTETEGKAAVGVFIDKSLSDYLFLNFAVVSRKGRLFSQSEGYTLWNEF